MLERRIHRLGKGRKKPNIEGAAIDDGPESVSAPVRATAKR